MHCFKLRSDRFSARTLDRQIIECNRSCCYSQVRIQRLRPTESSC